MALIASPRLESPILDVLSLLCQEGPSNARGSGCVWPGCDRTAGWTAAHHITHWAQGGATELDNLVLICHRHHWLVHEGGWNLVRGEEGRLAIAPVAEVACRARAPDDTPVC